MKIDCCYVQLDRDTSALQLFVFKLRVEQLEYFAEPRWPRGNTLAFNAENPGSTPGVEMNFSSQSTADRISSFQLALKVTFRTAISNAIFLWSTKLNRTTVVNKQKPS